MGDKKQEPTIPEYKGMESMGGDGPAQADTVVDETIGNGLDFYDEKFEDAIEKLRHVMEDSLHPHIPPPAEAGTAMEPPKIEGPKLEPGEKEEILKALDNVQKALEKRKDMMDTLDEPYMGEEMEWKADEEKDEKKGKGKGKGKGDGKGEEEEEEDSGSEGQVTHSEKKGKGKGKDDGKGEEEEEEDSGSEGSGSEEEDDLVKLITHEEEGPGGKKRKQRAKKAGKKMKKLGKKI